MHSVKGVADSDEPTESYHQCQTLQLPLTLHSIFTVFELIALLLWHITILAHVLGSHQPDFLAAAPGILQERRRAGRHLRASVPSN